MRLATVISHHGRHLPLSELPSPIRPDEIIAGAGPWELELGFGKGRYLLERAAARPERRFLGIELVSKYYRMARRRAERRGLTNLAVGRGEAHYVLATALPRGFADRVHVYFPDPWPKARHHKRRLFDPETVDLVLGAIRPGGRLEFATDFLDYGEIVVDILSGYPNLRLEIFDQPWPDGARTHYESRFVREGKPILRLHAHVAAEAEPGALHPAGRAGVLAAVAERRDD